MHDYMNIDLKLVNALVQNGDNLFVVDFLMREI